MAGKARRLAFYEKNRYTTECQIADDFAATKTKNPLARAFYFGGEGGIRTRGRLLTYARFPGV
jgi:hypothetical protein